MQAGRPSDPGDYLETVRIWEQIHERWCLTLTGQSEHGILQTSRSRLDGQGQVLLWPVAASCWWRAWPPLQLTAVSIYGIDFKGGTVVDVRFAGAPPIDTLRSGLAQQGIGNSTIVPVSDITTPNGNEVLINLEEKGQGSRSAGRRQDGHPECPACHAGRRRGWQAGLQRRGRGYR